MENKLEMGRYNPVSYTHLDVYKRQDMTSSELAKELGYTERRISQLIKKMCISDR